MAFPPSGGGGGSIPANMVIWLVIGILVFIALIFVFVFTAAFVWGPRLIRKLSGTTGPMVNGLSGEAIIESIADTGMTVSMRGVGAYAPDYRFVLQVSPAGGEATYRVETKALVPRLYLPLVVPGAHVGVLIDPTDPARVSIDFTRLADLSGRTWVAGQSEYSSVRT